MRAIALLLSWTALPLGCAAPERSSPIDFSGVDHFWSIAETLERDETPTPEAWEALFATPGYAVMVAHDNSDSLLQKVLPVALMPSRAREHDAWKEAGAWEGILADHLRSAVERRPRIEAFRRSIQDRDLACEAAREASAWLPVSGSPTPPPAVSFILLEPDARGYERIVMDLAFALDIEDWFDRMIAHEAHHVLRRPLMVVEPPPGEFAERDLLHGVEQLQAEGIADQIDKTEFLEPKDWGDQPSQRILATLQQRFIDAHADAPETLAGMDRLLTTYAAEPGRAPELGQELRGSLVLAGHPVGYYMACTILEAFGRERILENIGDPVAFALDYSAAASHLDDGRHVFSAAAVGGLEALRDAARRAVEAANAAPSLGAYQARGAISAARPGGAR